MESWQAQISAVAALDEPTRRQLYDYVIHQPEPVSRDDAAAALELPRTTAAFHLDRLVEEQLLDVVYRRRTGRTGPGAGRPAKLYHRSNQHVTVSLPQRRYGFEPRQDSGRVTLVNCLFHALAQESTELVCGMNLSLLDGLLDGLGTTGLTARLDPMPPFCCVRLEPAIAPSPHVDT